MQQNWKLFWIFLADGIWSCQNTIKTILNASTVYAYVIYERLSASALCRSIIITYSGRVPFSRFPHREITLTSSKTNKSSTAHSIGLLKDWERCNKCRRTYTKRAWNLEWRPLRASRPQSNFWTHKFVRARIRFALSRSPQQLRGE